MPESSDFQNTPGSSHCHRSTKDPLFKCSTMSKKYNCIRFVFNIIRYFSTVNIKCILTPQLANTQSLILYQFPAGWPTFLGGGPNRYANSGCPYDQRAPHSVIFKMTLWGAVSTTIPRRVFKGYRNKYV